MFLQANVKDRYYSQQCLDQTGRVKGCTHSAIEIFRQHLIDFLFLFFFLTRTGPLSTEYHWKEINITFHLIYNAMFSLFWFLSYKGKISTTPAPVLSILNKVIEIMHRPIKAFDEVRDR